MKATKYKKGILITLDGVHIEFKCPKPLTLEWIKKYAYHYAGVDRSNVKDIIPL